MKQQFGTDEAVSEAIEKYSDMVRRICFLYLKNYADVEDVFQEVFLKFFLCRASFENAEHERAWLCRVAFNKCKDLCKSFWRKRVVSIEEMDIPFESPEQEELIKEVMQLPPDQRQIIYLHYYEGRTVPEIAGIMGKNTNTVYTMLRRARESMRRRLGEDF